MENENETVTRPMFLFKFLPAILLGLVLVVVFLMVERVTVVPGKRLCFFGDQSEAVSYNCAWVKVVDKPIEIERGLSGKRWMLENIGMLFVFDSKEKHQFWMKEMKFDLDFLWIADNIVVDITEKVGKPENEELETFGPREEVDSVLELNEGRVEKWGVKVGDRVVVE